MADAGSQLATRRAPVPGEPLPATEKPHLVVSDPVISVSVRWSGPWGVPVTHAVTVAVWCRRWLVQRRTAPATSQRELRARSVRVANRASIQMQ